MKQQIQPFLFLRTIGCGWLCFWASLTIAQTPTIPLAEVQDNRPEVVALTNATIVEASGTLQNATLVMRGAYIEAVGTNIKIPAGATVIDCKGKRVYPSLIDPYGDYGMPEIKPAGGRNFRTQQPETTKKGAFGWNQALMPENDASMVFVGNATKADEWRKMGFGAVLSHQADGIVRGVGALIAPIDGRDHEALLKRQASANYSLSKGTSTQDYPSSPMGVLALLRQTYYDAQWYKSAKNRTETNISLDAFLTNQSAPQVFEGSDKLTIFRINELAKEFGNQYVIKTGGDEYQRIDEVKATGASLIVPLAFPAAPDVEDPFDADVVSLAELKHWEMAPANLATLQKAGITFAVTTAGLRNKADFWANLRKAIEYGLDKNAALAAMTSTAAKIIKADNLVGSLKAGMLANVLITSDDLFSKDNVIYENWVKGKRYVLNTVPTSDIRGNYTLSVGERKGKLNITGKTTAPEYQIIVNDSVKITPKVSRSENLLTMSFKLDAKKDKGDTRISSYVDGRNIRGDGYDGDGNPVKFLATFASEMKPDTTKKKEEVSKVPEVGKLLYPFVGLGNVERPKQENLLIKNATVWTNEAAGVVQNTDVLLQNGKIAQVGKNLTASPGVKTIDGTGKHLTTGIFDEHSHIALNGTNEGSQSVTSEVRMSDIVNSEDANIYRQLAGGVTSSQLLHGSANSIGGQSAVVKLKWGELPGNMLIKEAQFIKFALGENVKQSNWGIETRRFPQTRMGVEQTIRDAFQRAKDYKKLWNDYNTATNKAGLVAPRRDLELDALVEILDGKRHITCHSYVQSEINMLIKLADEMGFKVNTFTHILEGYKVADKMKAHGANASTFSDWWAYKNEVKEAIPYNATLMNKVGVTTAINSDDAEMARRLNQEAAKAVLYGGSTEEEAWKMVTLNVAKMMRLENRLGSIKVGKDADVVLWSDNPLSVYARPEKTIVEGTVYFDRESDLQKQAELAKERNRLIQKALASKSSGAPTARPDSRRPRTYGCAAVEQEAASFFWYKYQMGK
jgi:imidazolonepropionase-like amidohydrolase